MRHSAPRWPPSRVGRHEPRRSREPPVDACRADDPVRGRQGRQLGRRAGQGACRALLVFPASTASRPNLTPRDARPSSDTTLLTSGPRARALTSHADPPTRHRSQLTDFAQTAAVSTAVGAVVSTVLLAVAFALVLSFRWLVVPRGPSATHQELFLDFTRPAPTAVATFMPPRSVEAIEKLRRASPDKPVPSSALKSHRVIAPHQSYDVHLAFVLPESNAILHYLADGTEYLPGGRDTRACTLQYMPFNQYSNEPNIAVLRRWFAPSESTGRRGRSHTQTRRWA